MVAARDVAVVSVGRGSEVLPGAGEELMEPRAGRTG